MYAPRMASSVRFVSSLKFAIHLYDDFQTFDGSCLGCRSPWTSISTPMCEVPTASAHNLQQKYNFLGLLKTGPTEYNPVYLNTLAYMVLLLEVFDSACNIFPHHLLQEDRKPYILPETLRKRIFLCVNNINSMCLFRILVSAPITVKSQATTLTLQEDLLTAWNTKKLFSKCCVTYPFKREEWTGWFAGQWFLTETHK